MLDIHYRQDIIDSKAIADNAGSTANIGHPFQIAPIGMMRAIKRWLRFIPKPFSKAGLCGISGLPGLRGISGLPGLRGISGLLGITGLLCLLPAAKSRAQSPQQLSQPAAHASISASAASASESGVASKSGLDTLLVADPTIFCDRQTDADGRLRTRYYLYGTSGDETVRAGFRGYVSQDLVHWKPVNQNKEAADYLVLDSAHNFGNKGFWAPQVLSLGGKRPLLMAYTANEQIAIARSTAGPEGPFVQQKPAPLFKDGFKHIDPFIFRDSASGKTFIYYVKLDGGNKIFVAELNISGDGAGSKGDEQFLVVPGTERKCIDATAGWENTAATQWPVTEGPTVLYHNGFYYLFYSANDFRNPDYAVGYATAVSPTGPWVKSSDSPIITGKKTGLSGTGHGDVFQDQAGAFYYVFHAHHDNGRVSPRKTYLVPFQFKSSPRSQPAKSNQAHTPDKIEVNNNLVRPLLLVP